MSPGIVITIALLVVVSFVLMRWLRHEAATPVDTPAPAPPGPTMAARDDRESQPLVKWLLDRAFEQTGVQLGDDPLARERIAKAALQAMDDLRSSGSATVSLPFLHADARGPRHFNVQFKRNRDSTFELQH